MEQERRKEGENDEGESDEGESNEVPVCYLLTSIVERGRKSGAKSTNESDTQSSGSGSAMRHKMYVLLFLPPLFVHKANIMLDIDFEGRSDGRSIKAILTHVAPRKLILVRGSQAAIYLSYLRSLLPPLSSPLRFYFIDHHNDHLAQHAELTLKHICKSVVVPNVAECVDLTSDTSIFKLRLKDALLDSLDFAEVGDYELAYVDGRLIAPPQSSSGTLVFVSLPFCYLANVNL